MKNADSHFHANGFSGQLTYNGHQLMVPIKAVLFDYGMVLSAPPDPAAWQRMLDITGFDEKTLQHNYWIPRHDYDRGDLTGPQYWEKVAFTAGTILTPDQVTALLSADVDLWTQLNPPMLEWAQRLQRAGIRTGILSNIGDAMTEGILKKFEWICDFHHCTWSYRLRTAKPDLSIYKAAAEGLDTPPPNILFLDDKPENVDAARAVGMQPIQYIDHNTFEREMERLGLAHLLNPQPNL
jgi:putative hydrolase of the HAD superfamily